jgi:glutamate synthase (NADPH/NADH) small chain
MVGTDAVTALETVSIEWIKDENGRMTMKEIPGSEKVLNADLVLLAMGFLGPDDQLVDQLELTRDGRSNVVGDTVYQTSREKYFTAGDMHRGQSLVVWAIHEGRQAARSVHAFLTK